MPDLSLAFRLILAVVLLTAGASKLVDVPRFYRALSAYPFVGHLSSHVLSRAVPVAEVLLGLALAAGLWWREAAVLAALLLIVMTLAYVALVRAGGAPADCGCGGIIPESIPTRAHILVNALLIGFAVGIGLSAETSLAISVPSPLGGSVGEAGVGSAVTVLILLLTGAAAATFYPIWQLRASRVAHEHH